MLWCLTVFLLCPLCPSEASNALNRWAQSAAARIPPRRGHTVTGTDFLKRIANLDDPQREAVILNTLLGGNLPDFLKRFKAVTLTQDLQGGRTVQATFFVMPDYLAIGTDEDFVRMPMNLRSAGRIAIRFGCILPTCKMVNAIYEQSAYHYSPLPMPPGPQMRSTAYYAAHNRKIRAQRLSAGVPLGKLVSGHKKDVVITNRLFNKRDRIAIYGWHRLSGDPIQPLSTVHGAGYTDYSHGIRLVSGTVLIDGKPRSLCEVLEDPYLAPLFSDEGTIHHARWMLTLPSHYLSMGHASVGLQKPR